MSITQGLEQQLPQPERPRPIGLPRRRRHDNAGVQVGLKPIQIRKRQCAHQRAGDGRQQRQALMQHVQRPPRAPAQPDGRSPGSIRELRALAHPSGTLVLSGGGVSGEGRLVGPLGPLGLVARALVMARLPGARITIPQATSTHEGLTELADFISSGRIAPVIDRIYDFQQVADAIRYMETEHARAKVVVTVSHRDPDNDHDEGSHESDARTVQRAALPPTPRMAAQLTLRLDATYSNLMLASPPHQLPPSRLDVGLCRR